MSDIVATWNVPLHKQVHKIEFEHGTVTGKRVIKVDGKEICRREWMFRLVGKETFKVGTMDCTIEIDSYGTFAYQYTLEVNGKTFEKFQKEQNKKLHSWETTIGGHEWRVVLDKESMEVWANGNRVITTGEFIDNGSLTHFELGKSPCRIQFESSGKKKTGVTHTLFVNNTIIPSTTATGGAASSSS